jgi:hypothetical protein
VFVVVAIVVVAVVVAVVAVVVSKGNHCKHSTAQALSVK